MRYHPPDSCRLGEATRSRTIKPGRARPDAGATVSRLVFALALASAIVAGSPTQAEEWFDRALVGTEVGPTGAQSRGSSEDLGYAAEFDGGEIVEKSVEAGAEYVVIWARDGAFTYYDSAVQPKAPGLGGRDVLAEAVEAGGRLGVPIIAYCVLQYPTWSLEKNPGWRMRDSEGNAIERVCFNSPYIDQVKSLLREMAGYGIDGFHLDMVDQGFGPPHGCWCDHCQARFERRFGRPMPESTDWDPARDDLLEFRYDTSARFEADLEDFVKGELDGHLSVDFNYHGNPPFGWEVGQRPVQHAAAGDFITGETGTWGFSALGVGLNAEFYRAAAPGRRVQVVMQRGVRMYHDQTTRPLADMRWELFNLLAHGAFVTVVDKTAYDGWLDPVFYRRLGEMFREARAERGDFAGDPLPGVGIYYSHRHRDWTGRDEPASAWQGFLGAHKALVYEHVPWGIVLDENVTPQTLAAHRVVLLPNVSTLTQGEVIAFTKYVLNGGALVICGATGTAGPFGRRNGPSSLASLIGAQATAVLTSSDNHVRLADAPAALAQGIEPDWPFLVKGDAVVYEPLKAEAYGELLRPHRTVRQREGLEGVTSPMSADEPVGPAVLVNRFGSGTVVTIAASPDQATASEHAITEARRLLTNAIRLAMPAGPVTVSAPPTVESVLTFDAESETLRVHLLGYASPPAATPPRNRPFVLPPPIESRPTFRASITLPEPVDPATVWARSPATELEFDGNTIRATVDDVHDVITVEGIDPR